MENGTPVATAFQRASCSAPPILTTARAKAEELEGVADDGEAGLLGDGTLLGVEVPFGVDVLDPVALHADYVVVMLCVLPFIALVAIPEGNDRDQVGGAK
jgi:hypothetical protein